MNASSGEPDREEETERLYQLLLAHKQNQLSPQQRELVGEVLRAPRWQAHYESLRFLDMERAAARQDATDLRRLLEQPSTGWITRFCRAVAGSAGRVLVGVIDDQAATPEGSADEWDRHLDRCVYCRRMQRVALAREERPRPDEPLLRDRLLEGIYADVLRQVTRRVAGTEEPLCLRSPTASGAASVCRGGARFLPSYGQSYADPEPG